MDIGAAIMLGLAVAALLGYLVLNAIRMKAVTRRFAEQAKARGWSVIGGTGPLAYTVEGQARGVPFKVVSRRPTGMVGQTRGNAPTTTTVTMTAPRIEGHVIAHPIIQESFGSKLAFAMGGRMLHKLLLGSETSAVDEMNDVTGAFKGVFPSTHIVAATNAALAQQVFSKDTRQMLTELSRSFGHRRPIVMIRKSTSVAVRVLAEPSSIEDLDALIKMAQLLARPEG